MIAHANFPFDPGHNLNTEQAAKLIAYPGLVRAASFVAAASALALSIFLLVTMKISWSPESTPPDGPSFSLEQWIEPAPPPPRAEPQQPQRQTENNEVAQTVTELATTETTQTQTTTSEGMGASTITQPRWLEQPNARTFARYYPPRALDRGIGGRVLLDCMVGDDGRIGCNVASEDPAGMGFGEAARRSRKVSAWRRRPSMAAPPMAAAFECRSFFGRNKGTFRVSRDCPARSRLTKYAARLIPRMGSSAPLFFWPRYAL